MSLSRVSEFLPALAAIVIAALPVAAPSAAESAGIRVVFSDLNLSTPAGIDALYGRIKTAAARYCEPAQAVTGTRLSARYDRCVKDAIATTVQKVNTPGLTALHATRTGSAG
jgi:UrcA family protein